MVQVTCFIPDTRVHHQALECGGPEGVRLEVPHSQREPQRAWASEGQEGVPLGSFLRHSSENCRSSGDKTVGPEEPARGLPPGFSGVMLYASPL